MLSTVFAPGGSEKSEFLISLIKKQIAQSERKIMLIVPEQSSFETEKELYLLLEDTEYARLEIVSFTRLCDIIFERFGGNNACRIAKSGKMILSSLALSKSAPNLKVYASQSLSSSFSEKILSIIDELKAAGISAQSFEKSLAAFSENEQLYNKLYDLSVIYNFYEAELSKNYLDPADKLSDAVNALSDGAFFKDYDVIIDDFASFNGSQYAIMEKMMQNSPSVTVFLCTKGAAARTPAAFKTPNDTFGYLKKYAQRCGCEIKVPTILEAGRTYKNTELVLLEKIASGEEIQSPEKVENVRISAANNLKDECLYVAAEIHRLVREENYRYRDIAVIGRNIEGYVPHLEDAMRLYDIPFFADRREDIDSRPITIFIISLIETLISNIEPSRFISYLKCPLSPIDIDDATELENYIELWKISKRELVKDFEKNPEGLVGDPDEASLEKLNKLNQIRKNAVIPLIQLKKELEDKNGGEITRLIYKFMEQNGVIDKLSEYTNAIFETDTALASEQYRAYKSCLSAMGQLSALLENERVSLKRYLELFRLALSCEDVGSIPHHLDEVTVGDAGRMRNGKIKVSFLLGMNDGVFPARHSEDGIFTDADRTLIRNADIDILTTSSLLNQNENYYLYTALTTACDRVYISYAKNSLSGEGMFASKIVSRIRDALKIEVNELFKLDRMAILESNEAAFRELCLEYNNNTEYSNSLREYFMTQPDDSYRKKILAIDKGLSLKTTPLSEEASKKLYGKKMLISPSQIEMYHQCQFAHFCGYGLRLSAKKSAEIGANNVGDAIHLVLEKLMRDYTKQEITALSTQQLTEKAKEYLIEYMSLEIGSAAISDKRTSYSIMRLVSTIVPVIRLITAELNLSGFTPCDFELQVNRGKDVEPYTVVSQNGNEVGIKGRIDRVDVKKTDDKTYVRVVDYKSGEKKFDRGELNYGINLQMFLYLFSIWENGGKKYGSNVTPSGVLYTPAARPDVKIKGTEQGDAIFAMQKDEFKMSGMLLSDEEATTPDSKGFFKASYEDINGFTALKSQTEKLICKMADELMLGNLKVDPLFKSEQDYPCKYCDYKAICGFENGDEHRKLEKIRQKGGKANG